MRYVSMILLLLVMVILASAPGTPTAAQEPADAQKAADAPAADDPLVTKEAPSLGEIIFGSDWIGLSFYIVLAVLSVLATAVALERLVNLRRAKVVPPDFTRRLRELLLRRDDSMDNFRGLCVAHPSPAARVLRAAVLRAGRPLPEVEKAMEDAAARELAAIRSRNRILSVAGNVAPLVGLLGTVVGMIISFRIASQTGTGKGELLAEGIYIALLTTAGGLMIAIPCIVLAAWFNALAERYFREIDEQLAETLPTFRRLEDEAVVVADESKFAGSPSA